MTSKLFLSIVWVIRSSNKFAIFFSSFLAAITTETKGKTLEEDLTVENNEMELEDEKVHEIIALIKDKEDTLEEIEREVRKIKISTGVKDISRED